MSNTERLAIEALRLYLTAYQEHDQAAAIRAADKAARAALAAHDAEQEQAAQAVPADAERLRLAGLALIGLAEHDPHCTVFDLDDEGKHCACSCGYEEAIAVITQAGKMAPAAPAPEARQSDREAILARLEAVPVRSYEAERREVELLLSSPVDWKALWNECRAWNQCRAAMLAAAKGGTQ